MATISSTWPLHPNQQKNLALKLKEGKGISFTKAAISVETVPHPLNDLSKFLVGKSKKERPHQELSNSASTSTSETLPLMQEFVEKGLWHAVVDLSSSILTKHGQGAVHQTTNRPKLEHTEETLQVWQLRVVALWKMRHYTSVAAELATFRSFDEPDLRFEFYPDKYPNMKGSMVPFPLRIIHAEVLSINGQHGEALDRLYPLLHMCQMTLARLEKGLDEDGEDAETGDETKKQKIEMFKYRIHRIKFGIGNVLMTQKEFSLAMEVFESCITPSLPDGEKAAIASGLGRTALELGDVNQAKKYFERATGDGSDSVAQSMDAGMVSLCEGDYTSATSHFSSAWEADHTNFSAGNNMAVCLLYKGLLSEASKSMSAVLEKFSPSLDEVLVFNICTLFELQSNAANDRKRTFIPLAVEHAHDAFDLKSLKLSGIPQVTPPTTTATTTTTTTTPSTTQNSSSTPTTNTNTNTYPNAAKK